MQGKEASEQETQKCTAGIDVSKNWLDAHVLPASESLRVAKTRKGSVSSNAGCSSTRSISWRSRRPASGTAKCYRSLAASQIAVAVTDPYRVRMFAKAQGIFAKTDRLDAKVLAMFAAMMSPECRPPAPQDA